MAHDGQGLENKSMAEYAIVAHTSHTSCFGLHVAKAATIVLQRVNAPSGPRTIGSWLWQIRH